jgi:hypothetical protein
MLTILIILLVLALLSGFPFGNPGYDYRIGGSGVGLILLIILIFFLMGRL